MPQPNLVQQLLDAINSHDPQRVADCFAADYRCETPMHPERDFTGSDQVLRNWTGVFATNDDLRARVLRTAVTGAETWSEWEIIGTSIAGGAPTLIRGTVIWTADRGAITWTRFYLEPVTDASAVRPVPAPPTAAPREPTAVMTDLLGGYRVSQAVYAIAVTGVATVLDQDGPMTVAELARRTDTHPDVLARLVRALAPLGVFTTRGDEVAVTAVGATLSQTHPHSLHAVAVGSIDLHYPLFSRLLDTLRTGRPAADLHLGEPYFAWIGADPARTALFARVMGEYTAGLRTGIFDGYRLPPGDTVADIGGSDASVLVALLAQDDDPARRAVVLDRPDTIPLARPTLAAAGLDERVDLLAGDFFVEVPPAGIYLLSWILHDWDDVDCLRILGAIRAAAPSGARLLVVEGVVADGDEPDPMKDFDLTMLGILTGRERTEHQYRDLLDRAGFVVDRIVPTPTPLSILEATVRR